MNFQKWACLVALVLVPAGADAGPREDLIDGMAKCAAVANSAARLACYDALAPQLKAAQSAPQEPGDNRAWYDPGRIFGTSPAQQTTPQQFGAEALVAPPAPPPKPGEPQAPAPPQPLDSISAKVSDFAYNPYGRAVVFLDNGQIWQQILGDTDRPHFKKGEVNTVVISRGVLGSYNMVVNDAGSAIKVHRIK
ncbi:MAG TPA: hypothetical protein VNB30_03490 [Rhizomicrobium sp.]|jgi:hypothetical protein|nr:hypothetical protein [Rhizomicrobium sp.]